MLWNRGTSNCKRRNWKIRCLDTSDCRFMSTMGSSKCPSKNGEFKSKIGEEGTIQSIGELSMMNIHLVHGFKKTVILVVPFFLKGQILFAYVGLDDEIQKIFMSHNAFVRYALEKISADQDHRE